MIGSILAVFFTNIPYRIYKVGNSTSNMATTGIGLGLITAQRLFWITNVGMTVALYYKSPLLGVICISSYMLSVYKTKQLLKYLKK
jgi:hypothetical protein